MLVHELYCADNLEFLELAHNQGRRWDVAFADPPDNIDLGYDTYNDKIDQFEYHNLCRNWIKALLTVTNTVWWSFNARHTAMMGSIIWHMAGIEHKACVQTFTFGQHNKHDLGNCHRPLWRISRKGTCKLYPDSVRVPSWRQLNGDRRANPKGKIPGDVYAHPEDEVFDFPRVTGNSKQRRSWHPTQLHEGLVERCIKLTTEESGSVLDIFAGTGTSLRVCKRIGRVCTLVDTSHNYCLEIVKEHPEVVYHW